MTQPVPGERTTPRSGRGMRALEWWKRYCHPVDGDPATRAQLRRCRSAMEALTFPPAVSLARRVGSLREGSADDDWQLVAGLNLARVLAHVDEHDPARRPMQAAGWKSFPGDRRESDAGDDRPRLSEARFRRLVETEGGEELVTAFVRLVALLDRTVNVAALAEDFLTWGDRTKRQWAFHYYAAGAAAPAESATSTEDTDA